jgi:hypothetical protein
MTAGSPIDPCLFPLGFPLLILHTSKGLCQVPLADLTSEEIFELKLKGEGFGIVAT